MAFIALRPLHHLESVMMMSACFIGNTSGVMPTIRAFRPSRYVGRTPAGAERSASQSKAAFHEMAAQIPIGE
jgi:hypothetical protein